MTIKERRLDNGIALRFVDRSNRYFGDYNRILVEVEIRVPVSKTLPADDPRMPRARAQFGETLVVPKTLERMGVPTAELETVRDRMVEDFLKHAVLYMGRPDYPLRLLLVELEKARRITKFVPPQS